MSIISKLSAVAAGVSTLFFSAAALAAGPVAVPEPSTWALVGLAAAIGAAITRRRK